MDNYKEIADHFIAEMEHQLPIDDGNYRDVDRISRIILGMLIREAHPECFHDRHNLKMKMQALVRGNISIALDTITEGEVAC